MDLSSFQRKTIIFIFITILVGAILLARKEPLKEVSRRKEKIQKTLKTLAADKIDINTADLPQLTKLPGIGPGLAKQIIDYRDQHGPFNALNDLLKVPAIGPKRVERIKDKITLKQKHSSDNTENIKINLNTASSAQLATIAGIGPKMARAIIAYRTKNGPFQSLEELTDIPRIGEKTLAKLKNYLYIESPARSKADNEIASHRLIDTRKKSREIDTSLACPHCGKSLWEKGKKKKIHIRCPYCLNPLNET